MAAGPDDSRAPAGGERAAPPVAPAPPTVPGERIVRRPVPVWPYVLGILIIIFGACDIVAGPMSMLGAPLAEFAAEDAWDRLYAEVLRERAVYSVLQGVSSMLVGVAGIVLGAYLISRRWWVRRALLIWAVVSIARMAAMLLWAAAVVQTVVARGAALADEPFTRSAAEYARGELVMTLVIAAVDTVLPVFVIVWLLRPAIRAQVETWSRAQE